MRILLTGRNGQVGFELERCLAPLGEVVALGRAELDLADAQAVRAAVRNAAPELIVNAAAYTAVDQAEREPELARRINAEAPGILAEEAARLGAALIHYSTDYVFDGTKRTPYDELDPTNPLGVYGATKLAGERAIQAAGAPHLILRTSWVYATRGRNFLLTILRLAAEREQLRLVNDQTGAPTWAGAIAEATARIIKGTWSKENGRDRCREISGVYHLTAAGETTWYEFARAILAAPEAKRLQTRPLIAREIIPIRTADYPTPARRPAYSVLSNAKMARTFGLTMQEWRPQLHAALSSVTRSGG